MSVHLKLRAAELPGEKMTTAGLGAPWTRLDVRKKEQAQCKSHAVAHSTAWSHAGDLAVTLTVQSSINACSLSSFTFYDIFLGTLHPYFFVVIIFYGACLSSE